MDTKHLIVFLTYPEMVEDDPGAENISIEGDQVWLEGTDKEASLVSVDVHTVLLQQILLVSPALWPVLCQLFHLGKGCWDVEDEKNNNWEMDKY